MTPEVGRFYITTGVFEAEGVDDSEDSKEWHLSHNTKLLCIQAASDDYRARFEIINGIAHGTQIKINNDDLRHIQLSQSRSERTSGATSMSDNSNSGGVGSLLVKGLKDGAEMGLVMSTQDAMNFIVMKAAAKFGVPVEHLEFLFQTYPVLKELVDLITPAALVLATEAFPDNMPLADFVQREAAKCWTGRVTEGTHKYSKQMAEFLKEIAPELAMMAKAGSKQAGAVGQDLNVSGLAEQMEKLRQKTL